MNVFGGFVVTDRMLEMFRSASRNPSRAEAENSSDARSGVASLTGLSLAYLVAMACFIVSLRFLSNSARPGSSGNVVGAAGMAVAIGATFFQPG